MSEFNALKLPEMVATWPYTYDPSSITSAQMTMNQVPTSAWAKTANFDKLVLFNETDSNSIPTLILSKQLDYSSSGFPPATEQAMIQAGLRIVRPPTLFGATLCINFSRVPALANVRVRQAIAMAVDRTANGTISLGESGVSPKYMAGVGDSLLEQWVLPETLARLNPYTYDLEAAVAIFQAEWFTKDGDVWASASGERLEYEILVPGAAADWVSAATNLANQLTEFGIKAAVRTPTDQQFWQEMDDQNFQLAIAGWGTGESHPYFSLWSNFSHLNVAASSGEINELPMVQETQSLGEVDLTQLIRDSAAGTDIDAQKQVIGEMAIAFNELLSIIPIWERYANDPILVDVRVTGFPGDDDPLFKNSVYSDNFSIQWILDSTLKGVV